MKFKLLSTILLATTINSLAQVAGSNNYLPNYDPPSPEAAALGKYIDHPVSNYTGTPKIQIPLFEIKTGRITVPISLSYHASGVKIDEVASRVGMGWVLNAGGVITRTVKGFPDETPVTYTNGYPSDFHGYFSGNAQMNENSGYRPEFNDMEPDLHFYNFGDKSGKIYFVNKTTAFTTEKNPLKVIGPYDGPHRFVITDEDGIVYTFEATEGGNHVGPGYDQIEATNFSYTSSWFITKIYDPVTNKSVEFQYRTDMPAWYQYTLGATRFQSPICSIVARDGDSAPVNLVRTPKVLQKIIYDGGYIEFKADRNRVDLPGDRAYTEINHYVNYGIVVLKKGFNLYYTDVTAQGSDSNPANNTRLFLESVREKGSDNSFLPSYSFSYKNRESLPFRTSPQKDIWGYYNANGATSLEFPKIYVNDFGNKQDFLPFRRTDNLSTQIIAGAERTSNSNTIDYGSLSKITYPTGGYTEYTYEIHKFDDVFEGGGIRIKEIKDYPSSGTSILNKKFEYSQGTLGGPYPQAGYPSAIFPTVGVIRFTQNMSILGSCQGSNVGYGQVTVSEVNSSNFSNGKINYHYSTTKDVEGAFSSIRACGADFNMMRQESYFPFFEMESREARRGNLTAESYYDANNNLVKHIGYSYKLSSTPITSVDSYYIVKGEENYAVLVLKGTRNINAEKMLLESKQVVMSGLGENTYYTYSEDTHNANFLRSKTTYRSGTETVIDQDEGNDPFERTYYTYPFDYAGTVSNGVMGQMVAMNYLSPVISEVSVSKDSPTSPVYYREGKVTNYKLGTSVVTATPTMITPSSVSILNSPVPLAKGLSANPSVEVSDPGNPGALYEKRVEYLNYDYMSQPTMIRHDGLYENLSWSHDGLLLSKATSATAGGTSIDEYPPQSWGWWNDPWDVDGDGLIFIWDGYNEMPFHNFRMDGLSSTQLSFWAKGGTVQIWTGGQEDPFYQLITAPSGWTRYTVTIPPRQGRDDNGEVYMTGTATLDNVLITNASNVKTVYTYDTFRRLQSVTDPKNQMTRYEYDAFSRLIDIKDTNGNILKHTDYFYTRNQ